MASKETVANALEIMTAHWPRYQLTKATVKVYRLALQDMSDKILTHVVGHAIRTAKWFPKVSELLDIADALFTDEQNALDAEGAWGQVMRWRCHPARVKLPALVKAALDVLAIKEYSTEDTIMSDRARYCARFNALRDRKRSERRMLPEVRKLAESMRMDRQIVAKQLEASNE